MVRLATITSADRRRLVAGIHACATKLGMDTADKSPGSEYRSMLKSVGGKTSTTDMDEAALKRVQRHLLQTLNPDKQARPPDGWHADKMRRLWSQLGQLGALHEPDEAGMNRFIEHVTGKTAPRFCNTTEGNRVVEALKSWLAREQAKQQPQR